MRELCFTAQPPGQLPQQRLAVSRSSGELITFLRQKAADIFIRKHFPQTALAVNIDQIPVGACASLEHPDPKAFFAQPFVPAPHPLCEVFAVPRLIAEQPGSFQSGQDRRALFDHHGLKITLHG